MLKTHGVCPTYVFSSPTATSLNQLRNATHSYQRMLADRDLTELVSLTPSELNPAPLPVSCSSESELFLLSVLPFVPSLLTSEKEYPPPTSSLSGLWGYRGSFFRTVWQAKAANPLLNLCALTSFAV